MIEQHTEGQPGTKEEFRNTVLTCRGAVRKAKSHLEVMLTRSSNSNQKSYYCYFSENKLNKWDVWLDKVI